MYVHIYPHTCTCTTSLMYIMSSFNHQLQSPEKLHFLYEVLLNHDSRSMESLRVLLKIARALGRVTSPSAPSTVHIPPVVYCMYMCIEGLCSTI